MIEVGQVYEAVGWSDKNEVEILAIRQGECFTIDTESQFIDRMSIEKFNRHIEYEDFVLIGDNRKTFAKITRLDGVE
jgi:hypothetical protein